MEFYSLLPLFYFVIFDQVNLCLYEWSSYRLYPPNICTTSCLSTIPFCTKHVTVEQIYRKHVTMTMNMMDTQVCHYACRHTYANYDFIWAKWQRNYQLQARREKEPWWLKYNNLWAYSLRWYGYLSSNNECNCHSLKRI